MACAWFCVPGATAATQDDNLSFTVPDVGSDSPLYAQAELPEAYNFIVNERGQRFATLQAAIDAAQGKTTTITLNGGDKFHNYGNVVIRDGLNVTIQTGDASVVFANMKIEVNGSSLTIAGTSKNRIRSAANMVTSNANVTLKYCDIFRPFEQAQGSLKLENCKVIDLGTSIDKTSKATIVLTGNATCSLKDTKIDGDIYVSNGCTVSEVDGSTISNEGNRTRNGITIESGGALRKLSNSTICAAGAAIELKDGSTGPTIENTNLYGISECEIAVRGTVNGLKIEPSLNDSRRAMGLGGYLTKVKTTSSLWISDAIPKDYQLSRWTKDVKVTTAQGVPITMKVRYLVRTDCSVTYNANAEAGEYSGDMSAYNRTNQWADMKVTVASNKFTYEGASFTGWNTSPDGKGISYKPGQSLSFSYGCDVTLYAQWSNSKPTVTFNSKGGSAVPSQKVGKDQKAKRPADPTLAGYSFGGWYKDDSYLTKFDFSTPITTNTTLYAKWSQNIYKVSFVTNGGTEVKTKQVGHGEKVDKPADPARPNYEFQGWYADPEFKTPYEFDTPVTKHMSLYAKWNEVAHDHRWVFDRTVLYPTCTEAGIDRYKCEIDEGHAWYKETPALGHKPGQVVRENVHESDGCMDDAFHDEVVYCLTCGEELSRERKLDGHPGHVKSELIELTDDPTCTEDGLTIKKTECTVCGHELSYEEEEIAALGHDPGEETRENEVAPTCTSNGSYELVVRCARDDCDEELWRETVTVSKLGHDWSAWVEVEEPTYEKEGLEKHACTRCGQEETRAIPKLNHTHHLVHVDAQVATCTGEGHSEYWECVNDGEGNLGCGRWFLDEAGTQEVPYFDATVDEGGIVIECLGHERGEPTHENETAATCSKTGSYDEVVKCTRTGCGQEISRIKKAIPKIAHTEATETIVAVEQTCEYEGRTVTRKYCSVCKEELSRSEAITPALGHEADVNAEYYENIEEPTCTKDGSYDEVMYCSRCDEELYRIKETEPKLGHDWGAWTEETEATYETKGLEKRICARCSQEETRDIPTLVHVHHLVRIDAQQATCVDEGNIEYWECQDDESGNQGCGNWFLDETGDPEARVLDFDATIDEGGICIPQTAHVPDQVVNENVKEPTCTEDGSHDEVVRCANEACNHSVLSTTSVVDQAKGHTPSEVQREPGIEATCTESGYDIEYVECTVCEEELSLEPVETEPAGHTPGDPVKENIVEPTAGVDGSYDKVVYCSVCGQELSREKVVLPASDAKYLVVEGDGATWIQGSEQADLGLRFVFKRSEADDQTFRHFLGIRVDDEPVAESNYAAESGSVIITLLPAFLDTLSEGDHTITALFDDGAAVRATFTVKKLESTANKEAPNEPAATKGAAKSPSTGDSLLRSGCSALLVIAPIACALSIFAFRRRRE